MTNDLMRRGYGAQRRSGARAAPRGTAPCVHLIAAIALIFSLVIAVTAISIGIARAGSLPPLFDQTTLRG